jgi:hypothetical protein
LKPAPGRYSNRHAAWPNSGRKKAPPAQAEFRPEWMFFFCLHLAINDGLGDLIARGCRTAQQQGAAVCPGQSIPAKRLEGALLGRLRELAESDEWKPLQEALQGWNALDAAVRRHRLTTVLERIEYVGEREEGRVCWRAPLLDAAPATIQTRGPAAVRQPPWQSQESITTMAGRLPRITRLLALAVRFEGLLQDGTVRDYAEITSLPGAPARSVARQMGNHGERPDHRTLRAA